MAVQGWNPINYICTSADDEGNEIFEVVQLPILPPKRRPPICCCLGPHKHKVEEYEDGPDSPASPRIPKVAAKKTRPVAQAKYQDYPPETSHQEMINGDPSLLSHDNIYRIAQNYNMAELADAVNASHGMSLVTSQLLCNRLQRSVDAKVKREGRTRADVREELRQVQLANGVPLNGRKRKSDVGETGEQKVGKKRKAETKGEEKGPLKKRKVDAGSKIEEAAEEQKAGAEGEVNEVVEQNAGTQDSVKHVVNPNADTQDTVKEPANKQETDVEGNPKKIVEQNACTQDSVEEASKKRKADPKGEDKEGVKKQKSVTDVDLESNQEVTEKVSDGDNERNGAAKQANPDRVVTASGFVIWNVD